MDLMILNKEPSINRYLFEALVIHAQFVSTLCVCVCVNNVSGDEAIAFLKHSYLI